MRMTLPFMLVTDWKDLIASLEHDSALSNEWFETNCMKLNQEKCNLIISGDEQELLWTNIGISKIWEKEKQKFLEF